MAILRLVICVSGVYGAFLLWAIAQERLSKPFASRHPHHHPLSGDKFPSPLFFNWCQALASASCAAVYLLISAWKEGRLGDGLFTLLGLRRLLGGAEVTNGNGVAHANGKSSNGKSVAKQATVAKEEPPRPWYHTLPGLLLQVSLFQTLAGPIGFHALKSISYPTMVLAKSCKLIPVLLLNVLLYRRRFGAHKYLVVALVSAGISMFMFFGGKSKGGSDSAFGLGLLVVNLLIDGLTNSTQDQIFALYPGYSGQQMMFIMAFITLTLLTPAMLLPLPSHPWGAISALISSSREIGVSSHLDFSPPIILQSLRFLVNHPTALAPLGAYAALGGLGQIFIFETIAHFGSLTLVMITVTRKLFTMLLSVFVFGHKLTPGQWAGVAVVFAGIGVEAGFKRKEAARRVKRDKTE